MWRAIAGWEGLYEVSDEGQVRSLDRVVQRASTAMTQKGKILTAGLSGDGYPRVTLTKPGTGSQKHFLVHLLVLEAFVGPRPNKMIGCHGDDNPKNNRLDNLSWGTRRQNALDAVMNGRNHMANRSSCHAGHEYTEENTQVRPIDGARICRTCRRENAKLARDQKKLAAEGTDPVPVSSNPA